MVSIASDRIKSSMLKKKVGFEITANYSKDIISIYSSDNLGLVGSYLTSTGDLYGSINSGDIMSLKLDGRFNQNTVNIRLSDININLNKLISYYDVKDMILIESGIIKGALTLSGSLDTPDFKGALTINKPKLYIPSVFPDDLSADVLMLTAANNELTLREDTYYMKKDPIFTLGAKIFLDKWQVDTISAKMTTLKKKYLPLKFKSPFVNINGKIGADVNIKGEEPL